MLTEKFWEEVHKKAVIFRNRKRQQYLNGDLTIGEESFVERWDCEPNDKIKEMAKELGVNPPKKMFNVLLSEEPLSIDVRLKKDGF